MAPGDEVLEEAVREFNRFDLYTKADSLPDFDAVWPHYQGIVDELCPGMLDW
jgi:inositol oxygenase